MNGSTQLFELAALHVHAKLALLLSPFSDAALQIRMSFEGLYLHIRSRAVWLRTGTRRHTSWVAARDCMPLHNLARETRRTRRNVGGPLIWAQCLSA